MFTYEHAGKISLSKWYIYKSKELWILLYSLLSVILSRHDVIVIHNTEINKKYFVEDFMDKYGYNIYNKVGSIKVICANPDLSIIKIIIIPIAFMLTFMPVRILVRLVCYLIKSKRQIKECLIYCDAHLSGYIMLLAMKELNIHTATLQHGLYRGDDKGSIMALKNFVADIIYMWDDITKNEYLKYGYEECRLIKIGQYGFFESDINASWEKKDDRCYMLFCPSYSEKDVDLFVDLANNVTNIKSKKFSIHPILRDRYDYLDIVDIKKIKSKPIVAVCGDSGVIMECLGRSIPIITISKRNMSSVNVQKNIINTINGDNLLNLINKAQKAIKEDRLKYGFKI